MSHGIPCKLIHCQIWPKLLGEMLFSPSPWAQQLPFGKTKESWRTCHCVARWKKKKHTSLITVITQVTDFFCSSGQDFTGISLSQSSKVRLWSPEKATGATLVLKTLMKFIFTAPFSVISYFKTNMSSFHYLGTKVKEQIMVSPTGSIIGQCIFNNYTVLQV